MKLDPRISKVYFINLDERKDRLESITNELKKIGVNNAIRIPAVKTGSVAGANRSHILAFNEAERDNAEYYMVFEDDAYFHVNPIERINKAFEDVIQREWGILFMGCRPNIERVGYPPLHKLKNNTNLIKVNSAYPTHAIIYNRKHAVDFNRVCKELYPFDRIGSHELPFDVLASRYYCHRDLAYCTYDCVSSQRPDMSDVSGILGTAAYLLREDFEKYREIAPIID